MKINDKVKCITTDKDAIEYFKLETNKEYTINNTGKHDWNGVFNYLPSGIVDCVVIKELYGGYIPQQYFELIENKEKLLEYARINYPIGTQYIPAHTHPNGINEVVNTDYTFWDNSERITIDSKCIKENYSNNIYYEGKWAEIVSKPEEEVKSIYSRVRWKVGDNLKSIRDTTTYCWNKNGENQSKSSIQKTNIYEVGEISKIQPDLFRFLIDIKYNIDTWYMENDFELAYLPKQDKTITSFNEYKIGSIVKTLQTGGNSSNHKKYKKDYEKVGELLEIESFEKDYQGYILAICKEGYVVYIEQYPKKFELVTNVFKENKSNTVILLGNCRKALDHEIPKHSLQEAVNKFNTQSKTTLNIPEKYVMGMDPFEIKKEFIKREPKVGDYVVVTQCNYGNGKVERIKAKANENYWLLTKYGIKFCFNSPHVDDQFRFATDEEVHQEVQNGSIKLSDYINHLQDPLNEVDYIKKTFNIGELYNTKLPYLGTFYKDEVQLLQSKDDKLFNTSVNKIESVTIQLKQKNKSIKF